MRPQHTHLSFIFLFAACVAVSLSAQTTNAQDVIRFDIRPTAPAFASADDPLLMTCNFQLSSLIASPSVPRIDQWLVKFQPRDPQVSITDYAPRTDLGSDVDGPVQVKTINEQKKSLGLSLNGDYAKALQGSAAAEGYTKTTDSEQYNRIAPVQAVTASGSINRGRGVYFKLRWTAQQVLEGEKSFQLTFQVPPQWRGSLIDISVSAQSQRHSFAGWDNQIKTLGSANYVVAVHPQGDREAAKQAKRIALAEQALRDTVALYPQRQSPQSLPAMIRHVAVKLNLDSPCPDHRWIQRLLKGEADPYMDREISKLPMEVRVAAIDYHDARNKFAQLSRRPF